MNSMLTISHRLFAAAAGESTGSPRTRNRTGRATVIDIPGRHAGAAAPRPCGPVHPWLAIQACAGTGLQPRG